MPYLRCQKDGCDCELTKKTRIPGNGISFSKEYAILHGEPELRIFAQFVAFSFK